MKPSILLAPLVLAAFGLVLPPCGVGAGLPQPMCIYYGQARDAYGLPYLTNADVILLHGNREIARQTIAGTLAPGVNFALYVHLDDGRSGTTYSPRAIRSGDLVSIVVRDSEGQKEIMENEAVPPVGRPGDLISINATAGTDLDRDGLPDRWEEELIASSAGALQTLAEVRASDDFDGDGMSNLEEYRAGTFAFLDYDYLFIEELAFASNQRLRLTFLSVPGKIYTAFCASDLMPGAWEPTPFALSESGPVQVTPVEGNGDWLSLYVPVEAPSRFFRLEAR